MKAVVQGRELLSFIADISSISRCFAWLQRAGLARRIVVFQFRSEAGKNPHNR